MKVATNKYLKEHEQESFLTQTLRKNMLTLEAINKSTKKLKLNQLYQSFNAWIKNIKASKSWHTRVSELIRVGVLALKFFSELN